MHIGACLKPSHQYRLPISICACLSAQHIHGLAVVRSIGIVECGVEDRQADRSRSAEDQLTVTWDEAKENRKQTEESMLYPRKC